MRATFYQAQTRPSIQRFIVYGDIGEKHTECKLSHHQSFSPVMLLAAQPWTSCSCDPCWFWGPKSWHIIPPLHTPAEKQLPACYGIYLQGSRKETYDIFKHSWVRSVCAGLLAQMTAVKSVNSEVCELHHRFRILTFKDMFPEYKNLEPGFRSSLLHFW